jgi:hypothetical protein
VVAELNYSLADMVGSSRMMGRMLVAAAGLALPQAAQCQVGITSGLIQIGLVAHVAPRASIQALSATRETGRVSGLRATSATVRIAANTGYRLVVRAAGVPTSRIWVRAASGEFQELTAGSSITVARGAHTAGQVEREVQYRLDSAGGETSLPVRYEIAISPQL